MNTTTLVLAALAAPPFLCAQNDKPAPVAGMQMPDPKTKEHGLLAAFVGQWQTTTKTHAVPGVPGMEKPFESTGSEQIELVCNGLWLKAVSQGTCAENKPLHGIWLVGYDPWQKKYTSIWASNLDEPSSTAAGSYDAATKTWTFTGESPFGAFRSALSWQDADTSKETCCLVAADGKETPCMESVRKRIKGAKATDAVANFAKPASKELALLAEGIGTWDAVVKTSAPGAPPTEEKATERVMPICDGKWFWSDWKGSMMGMPFEGHALTGYEPTTKKFVSYWIDSASATHSCTTGVYDEAKKAFTMTGSCRDMEGKPATIEQTCTQSTDVRAMTMKMKGEAMTHVMEIAYKRAKG